MADLIKDATQLVEWGSVPALATRVSIPNVNLLGTKGSILYGTGNPLTKNATIGEETYQYAEVKALEAPSGTEQFILSNNSDGNLRYVPVINDYTDYGSKLGVLSALVAYDINQKLHIANAATGTGISMGDGARGSNAGAIAIGNKAIATGDDDGFAIAIGNNANADNKNIAIGSNAIASSYASPTIQLGVGENRTPNSFQVWSTPMLVDGKIPQTSIWPEINTSGTVNIGMNISGSTDCVAIGNNTVGAKNSVAVGKHAEAKEYGTAIGSASTTLAQSIAGENGVAVGYGAQASGKYCVAIGSGAITGPESNEYYIQIGNIDVGMTMGVGKYELMGSDGYIKPKRLSIYKHHIYWRFGYFSITYILYFDIYNYNATKYTESDMVSVAGFKGLFVCNGLCTDNYSKYCPMVETVFSSTPSSTGIVTNNITLKYIEDGIKQITIPSADIVTSSFEDSVSNILL